MMKKVVSEIFLNIFENTENIYDRYRFLLFIIYI